MPKRRITLKSAFQEGNIIEFGRLLLNRLYKLKKEKKWDAVATEEIARWVGLDGSTSSVRYVTKYLRSVAEYYGYDMIHPIGNADLWYVVIGDITPSKIQRRYKLLKKRKSGF